MIPDQAENHAPSGAICPASVEEIQKVLAVSRQYRIPLWTISVGRNYGYGEAAPATPGQMVLDLKRMNRILEVDAELGTALVEPGVTFQQLADYIEEHKLPFWLNKPAPAPLVGPVGWTLERGMGYTRYQEAAQHFSGMEVVLADGSVVRTGMGGVANAKSWTAYRFGYGPQIDGLFMQSNLGIVTKMGIWLMKKPAATKTWVAGFRNFDDATLAVEVLRDTSHVRDYSAAEWQRQVSEAGLHVRSHTRQPLRLEFTSWVERMRTPEPMRVAIRQLQQAMGEEVRQYYQIEADGSFSTDVLVLWAER